MKDHQNVISSHAAAMPSRDRRGYPGAANVMHKDCPACHDQHHLGKGLTMIIRECRESDLPLLELHIPSGRNRTHEVHFHRQQQGLSTFQTAWIDDVPVGFGEVRWRGCAAAEAHERYPDCPELNGLSVWPPQRQSHGIGTAIIHATEALAAQRGYRHIGLGVDDKNHRAATLYLRLGHQETGCRYLDRYHRIDDHGIRQEVANPCRFLIKPLQNMDDQRFSR
ncbi:GNAT family N-acetyltransferase [Nonomuraea sp. NPDC051941]|uniref:GNAT family N-acetyltransferase n=1 Tax=Nonomuraea sp. NPDC051941 TaxID=3364373 RepID=UPI0037CAEBE8